jgi:hypothetical protein
MDQGLGIREYGLGIKDQRRRAGAPGLDFETWEVHSLRREKAAGFCLKEKPADPIQPPCPILSPFFWR